MNKLLLFRNKQKCDYEISYTQNNIISHRFVVISDGNRYSFTMIIYFSKELNLFQISANLSLGPNMQTPENQNQAYVLLNVAFNV